jgi:type IV secretory pathway VirB2 component (pilin)
MPSSRPDLNASVRQPGSARGHQPRVRTCPDTGRGAARRAVRRAGTVIIAALALTGLAFTSAASSSALAAPAPATTHPAVPAWDIVKQVHNGPFGGFTAVIAVGRTGGWAFNQGTVPTAWRRSGSTWTQLPFPGKPNEVVVAAGAASPADVWAFTAAGVQSRALRWNGRSWTVQRSFAQQIGGAVVISPSDIWVFGQPYFPGPGLGAWHYNGHTWSQVASGRGLQGGSALAANNIWAVDGSDIAHWNGSAWSRTSVSHLLPAKQELNGPMLTGIFAQSAHSVYAIGNGGRQDEGGPLVILHWNGHQWFKAAEGNYGFGTQPLQQASSDGHGGLWLPMPGADGQKSYLLHYTPGRPLAEASLPYGPNGISIEAVALIPGSTDLLAGGDTHASDKPGTNVVAVLLQYGS